MEQEASIAPSDAEIFHALRRLRVKRGISLEKLEVAPALLSLQSVRRQAKSEGRTDALHEVAYEVLECFLGNEMRNLEAAQRTVYVELNFERRQDWVGDREGAVAYELGIQQNYEQHSKAAYEAVAIALRRLEVSPCATDEPARDLARDKLVVAQTGVLIDVITRALIGLALLKGRDPETRDEVEELLRQHLSNAFRVAVELGPDFWPDTSDPVEILRGIVRKIGRSGLYRFRRRIHKVSADAFQLKNELSAEQIESTLFPIRSPANVNNPAWTTETDVVERTLSLFAIVMATIEVEDGWLEVLQDDRVTDSVTSDVS